jgi:outer membrane protein assembly factor BamB
VSYHPRTGAILWTCSGLSCQKGDLAYSSPCVSGDVCVILGGFEGPEIGIRLAQNRGDVTGTHRIWRHPNRPSNCGSGVAAGGHVYIPDMRGMIVCLDPATGKRLWSDRAVKGAVWSSIVLADGKLYAMNQRGATTVFRPNAKKLDVIATNELNEPTNSTPAFAGGEIFLRTHEHIYCVASPADTPARAATPKTTPRKPPRERGA